MSDPIKDLELLAEARKKATDGPWLWDKPDNWLGLSARVCTTDYKPIAQVQCAGWKPASVGPRNAAFIALAGSLDIESLLAHVKAMEKVCEAAADVARHGQWVPAGADNYDYMSMVSGVVGTDWNNLVQTLSLLDGKGAEPQGAESNPKNSMLYINGSKTAHRCGCGCNVYRKLSDTTYECNSCGDVVAGD